MSDYINFQGTEFKIPDIAAGKVVPPIVDRLVAGGQQGSASQCDGEVKGRTAHPSSPWCTNGTRKITVRCLACTYTLGGSHEELRLWLADGRLFYQAIQTRLRLHRQNYPC